VDQAHPPRAGDGAAVNAAIPETWFTTLAALRVEIHTSHRNVRSQRVTERCGFVLEGRLRDFDREPSGELRDEMLGGQKPQKKPLPKLSSRSSRTQPFTPVRSLRRKVQVVPSVLRVKQK
jgi:hypothetical protein